MADEELGALVVRIEANIKDLKTKMDQAISAMQDTEKKAMGLSEGIKNAFAFAGGFAIFETIRSGFENSVKAGFQFNSTMQQNKIALESMLGSAARADATLGKLSKMAAETPFEFPQLAAATKKMIAFGFESEKIPTMLKNIGDAASGLGLGAAGVDRITTALGQMSAKGKISAEEMMQLTEAGVPAWDILAKAMGKSTAEVMKLSEKGLLPARQAINALVQGMEERFPNMMAKQSKSFEGLMSTLRDNVQITFGAVLKPAFDNLTNTILPNVINKLDAFTKKMGDQGVGPAIESLILSLGKLLPLITGVAFAFTAYNAALKANMIIVPLSQAWAYASTVLALLREGYALATIAQMELNLAMAANPVGMLAMAIGGLIMIITALVMRHRSAVAEMREQQIKGIIKERDTTLKAIDAQHKSKLDSLSKQLDEERSAHDKRLSIIQSESEKHSQASKKRNEDLRKSLEERKSLLDKEHNETIQRIRDEYGVFEDKETSKTAIAFKKAEDRKKILDEEVKDAEKAADDQEKTYQKFYDNTVKDAERAHKEKTKMLNDEYIKAIRLVDEDLAKKIEGFQDEIDGINDKTDEENKIIEDQRNQEKILELQKRIAEAKNSDERIAAVKALATEINRINREKELENRKIQIDALKDQIDTAKENAEQQKITLKDALTARKYALDTELQEAKDRAKADLETKINNEKAKLEAFKIRITDEKTEIDAKAKVEVLAIQKERIAKETAETTKYTKSKESLDRQLAALDDFKEGYSTRLKNEVSAKAKAEEDKFKAVEDRIKKELKAEEDKLIAEKKLVEDRAKAAIEKAKKSNPKNNQVTVIEHVFGAPTSPINSKITIPKFANGITNFRGGAAIVGEKGPEVLNLPKGSNVTPNNKLNALGQTINNNFYLEGLRIRDDNDIKLVAKELFNLQTTRARAGGTVYG